MRDRVVIGSRGSKLALWQTNHIADLLRAAAPGLTVDIEIISTRGDRILDKPLPEIGGKGVFTEELERALRDESIDLAVHSLKDLPVQEPDGLIVGAIPKRASPLDVLVTRDSLTLETLPQAATVGTSSLRRKAQLLLQRPDLNIVDLRGNVETRIAKVLDRRELDAAVLAHAGIDRLGLDKFVSEVLKPEVMLPAPGQGALAVQCREDDDEVLDLLAHLDHGATRAEVTAERALLQGLGGGCSAPIGALVRSGNDSVGVWCGIFGPPGKESVRMAMARNNAKPPFDLDPIVAQMLESLRERGADEILGYYR